ncbi:MAG: sugar transferase [Candidatus Aminicenantes bacterium]|nr:MAG: sugar transferase [Candidatus Aminicenantes bacterium]
MQEQRRKGFLKRNWELIYSFVSFFLDLFFLNFSFLFSFWLLFGNFRNIQDYSVPLVVINLLFLLVSFGLGIYRSRHNLSSRSLCLYYLQLVLSVAILTMAFLFIIKGQGYSSQLILLTFLIMLLQFELVHLLIRTIQNKMAKMRWIGFRTIIIGTDDLAWKFYLMLKEAFGSYFQILGYVQDERNIKNQPNKNLKNFIIGPISRLDEFIPIYQPDVIYALSETADIDKFTEAHKICYKNFVKLKIVSPQFNRILNHPKIRDVLGISLVFDSWRIYYWKFNSRIKRVLDILFVLFMIPIILSLGTIIGFFVKLSSKGPVFFKQKRTLYKGGCEFTCFKFRSMYGNAEDLKKDLMIKNESNGALFKIKGDPRITPCGRIIRKLSLDELPQFINVLKGEMSVVGPRPLPVEDFEKIEELDIYLEWQKQRGIVKPGITGLWQILGRSKMSFEEMLFLDLYYIEHQSIFLDLEIFFSTLSSILFGKGAY